MKHSTLIPKDHPQAHLLDQLTHQVLDLINVSEAFISVDNSTPEIIFTFLIDTTYTRIDNEILLPLHRIFQNHPSIAYRVFSCDYTSDALRKANLYFLRHCTLGTMIYSNPSTTHVVDLESELTSILLPRTKKHFKRAMARIDGRYTDFPKCLKFEKFVDGAYILHQMLEQLFKLAELFLLGKQVFSKDIAEHQGELLVFAPSLAMLFNSKDEEEARLQKVLYSAYLAYRNKDRLGMDREDLQKLLFKTQWARQEVERLFKEGILDCYQKTQVEAETIKTEKWVDDNYLQECNVEKVEENDSENIVETKRDTISLIHAVQPSEQYKQLLIDTIRDYVSTSGIYCFAMRNSSSSHINSIYNEHSGNKNNEHYYLLVITNEDKRNAIGDLSNTINIKTNGRCTVTLLIHKATSLRNLTEHQLCFFHLAMTKGYTLYEHEIVPPGIPFSKEHKRKTNLLHAYWKSRDRIASTFLDAEYQIDIPATEVIKETMMHIAVEQICLGLLDVFLGYRPLNHSFGYLFDLCEIFCPLTSEYFPRNTQHDMKLFELLNTSLSMLRHAEVKDIGFANTELLEKRCSLFYEKAYEMIETELERLENSESEALLQYKKN